MKNIFFPAFAALLSIVAANAAKSQNTADQHSQFYVAGGLTTLWINGYNAGGEPIFVKDTAQALGGGIYGQQPGISLQGIYMLDSERNYRLTFGGDYFYLSGGQHMEEKFFTLTARHTLNIASFYGGFDYSFATLPLANAKIYAGAEARVSIIDNIRFESHIYYKDFRTWDIRNYDVKESAARLGAALRLGVEGELLDPVYVNMSAAYNALNLLNRNDVRGELLTPGKTNEIKESVVGNILFSFWLQYRL